MRRADRMGGMDVYALLCPRFYFFKIIRICRVKDNVSFLSAEVFISFTRHENRILNDLQFVFYLPSER